MKCEKQSRQALVSQCDEICNNFYYMLQFSGRILNLIMLTFPQDQGLEMISEGLDTLKNMAHDMNEVC